MYIDKTGRIYDLIKTKGSRFFLSRPRRFGKTLLVSILEQIFKGNKELFKGLAIYDKDYDWKVFPVIRISLSRFSGTSVDDLKLFLIEIMRGVVENHNVDINELMKDYIVSAGNILHRLIEHYAKQNKKVVILIDEYDYPVISNINSSGVDDLRETLKGFYSVLKDDSEYIHQKYTEIASKRGNPYSKISFID